MPKQRTVYSSLTPATVQSPQTDVKFGMTSDVRSGRLGSQVCAIQTPGVLGFLTYHTMVTRAAS